MPAFAARILEENCTKFVVGLGNPGRQYQRTRHNVGYMVLAELCRKWQVGPSRHAFSGEFYETRRGGQKIMLLAPMTYMNLSGTAVLNMAGFYKAPIQDVLVVLDDLALPLGKLRFRSGGSSGGQKGLGDIIARLGSSEVPRLRIGIGPKPEMIDGADYVLGKFSPQEVEIVQPAIELAAQAVEDWVFRGMTFVMEKYNRMGQPAQEDEG